MIRINLLPQAKDRRSGPETNQGWLLAVMGVIVVEIIILFFFHQTKQDELDELEDKVAEIRKQVRDIKSKIKDHAEIKAALEELRAREDAISQLETARAGPTAVLLEVSRLLTPGKGPTADAKKLEQLRRENPLAVYNPSWDVKRLWLKKYNESERSLRLEGVARDGIDVYEFSQRLKLSVYFSEVTLLAGQQSKKGAGDVDLVKFALQVKVKY